MRTTNVLALNAVDASTTQNSSAIYLGGLTQLFSAQGVITGSANTTVLIQYSNDAGPATATPTNWDTVPSSSATVTSSSDFTFQSVLCSYNWIRVRSTNNSGTGTLSVRLTTAGWH